MRIVKNFALIFVLCVLSVFAQEEDYLESTSGGVKVRLGILGDATGQEFLGQSLAQLRKDLEFDGRFNLYEAPEVEASWRSLGIQYYTTAKLHRQGSHLYLLELTLNDFYSGEILFGRQYEIKEQQMAQAVHDFSDEVVRFIYGSPGLMSTKLLGVQRASSSKNLVILNLDGKLELQLTKGEGIRTFPTWGPNGESIIYTAFDEGYPTLYQIKADGSKKRRLLPSRVRGITPAYIPNSDEVVYSEQSDDYSNLKKLNLKTLERTTLTDYRGNELSPSYGPMGEKLYFTWDRGISPQIYEYQGTQTPKRLTFVNNYNESVAVSPRGDKIAYCTMLNGLLDIMVQDLATGQMIQLTYLQGNNESPTWSPDGRFIAFASTRSGKSQIYVMAADGTGVRQITRDGEYFQPRWSGYNHQKEKTK